MRFRTVVHTSARRVIGLEFFILIAASCRIGNFIDDASSTLLVDPPQTINRLLLMVYMNGDNELEPQALQSLNQLESVDVSEKGVSVVVLLDRSPGYDTSNGDWTDTRLFEVAYDPEGINDQIVSVPLASPELGLSASVGRELDLGNPESLSRFVKFAREAYPAEATMLILWGHGSGWRSSLASPSPRAIVHAVSFDDSSGSDPLFTQELGAALAGEQIDILGFDCCSEALIEVAFQLKETARFMVASEDLIQTDGWNYADLLARIADGGTDAEAVLDAVVDSFASQQENTAGSTISAISLRSIAETVESLNSFSDAAWSWIDDDDRQSLLRLLLFSEVEAFFTSPGDLNLDLMDMGRVVAERIGALSEASQTLEAAVTAAVVREWHHPQGHPNAHGIGIHYVPLSDDGAASVHADGYFRGLPTQYPLAFVSSSSWVPEYPRGPGLLYRIWYEVF